MSTPLKVLIFDPDPRMLSWLEHTLYASRLSVEISPFTGICKQAKRETYQQAELAIICESLLQKVLKHLQKQMDEFNLPFPVIVLREHDNVILSNKYQHLTIDSFPKAALTPEILKHLVESSQRDFDKEKQLRKLAHFDSLTGATNRHLFNDRLQQAWLRSKRNKEPLALLYLDLNKFKLVNDTWGHHIGDRLLMSFTRIVKQNIRESDTLARFGGDEFGILLPNSDEKIAQSIADDIIEALSKPVKLEGIELSILTSIGIADARDCSNKTRPLEVLCQRADTALYNAKRKGDNRTTCYSELEAQETDFS